jgi:hypothetical protein
MIGKEAAARILAFDRTVSDEQAALQLEGAVALHNILARHGVAYLADEVGMGKTYVALGALALFRHANPNFRVLVISPRKNIQQKWTKELSNFTRQNFVPNDMRVRSLDGGPARESVHCDRLIDLVRAASVAPDRDFFARMTSFSLALGAGDGGVDAKDARKMRDELRRQVPWLRDEVFDMRNRAEFKDNIARAVCCALPSFDLVIVDEAHNLRHGFRDDSAARNRVLALAMGHPRGGSDGRLFPGFGPRASRVLFLSATPVEDSFLQLWNQLDVMGKASCPGLDLGLLKDPHAELAEQEAVIRRFLVRRVRHARIGGEAHSKNLYRREWRGGGMQTHDEPIEVADTRQKLIVALVQKKVGEVLGATRFNNSFQTGMLASFESFLETTGLARGEHGEESAFDGTDQTDDAAERRGADVPALNRLAKDYFRTFGATMPHPKMDALVDRIDGAWQRGEKALVFVRRVASVAEIREKLNERYDAWLRGWLGRELPEWARESIEAAFAEYQRVRHERITAARGAHRDGAVESGSFDTFFAWYFRGEQAKGRYTGAMASASLNDERGGLSLFFERNLAAELLGVEPAAVPHALAARLRLTEDACVEQVAQRAALLLPRLAKIERWHRFDAVQRAAVELLAESEDSSTVAAMLLHAAGQRARIASRSRIVDCAELLRTATLFTELAKFPELEQRLGMRRSAGDALDEAAWRERELRARLLSSTARLGHAFLDLFVPIVESRGTLASSARAGSAMRFEDVIARYLGRLERQRCTPLAERSFGAFDELAAVAEHFDLIMQTNCPELRNSELAEATRHFGQLLGSQEPVAGMAGSVNVTMVRQFRMPGYPFALVTTDVLQEGEDLHTFCSSIYHYGIAWTPSATEQRTGRIDRVKSLSERRFAALGAGPLAEDAKMQVYYPYLEDTVEVVQNDRVFHRMNRFLELMHTGLTMQKDAGESRVDVAREMTQGRRRAPQIKDLLHSRFGIDRALLRGRPPAITGTVLDPAALRARVKALAEAMASWGHKVEDSRRDDGLLRAEATLASGRIQPFSLWLHLVDGRLAIRCTSPVGIVDPRRAADSVLHHCSDARIGVGAIEVRERDQFDLTTEASVLLRMEPTHDAPRVKLLIEAVLEAADGLERALLPGNDAPLGEFDRQLSSEVTHG